MKAKNWLHCKQKNDQVRVDVDLNGGFMGSNLPFFRSAPLHETPTIGNPKFWPAYRPKFFVMQACQSEFTPINMKWGRLGLR